MQQVTGNLATLIPRNWFADWEHSSVWVRIYTSLFIPHSVFIETASAFLDASTSSSLESPTECVLIAFGHIDGMKMPAMTTELFAEESGKTRVSVKVNEKELPRTNYVFLYAPFEVDGKPGDEAKARRKLDTRASLLCLHAGLNFMRDCVYEGEVNAKDGSFGSRGTPWRMPQACEGPFLATQNGAEFVSVLQAIRALPEPKRGRIELALHLVNEAMRKDYGFLEYWTALEVICDGKANRIKERLRSIYGLKSHSAAGDQTGLNVLARWRGEYVHKGIRPYLSPDVERYVQLVFLELLRAEVGLPTQFILAAVQTATGYNLSPLGLPDNRTEEQREAAARLPSKGF